MGIPYAEVIGDPVENSKSPLIHKFWLNKLGLDYDYRATHVSTEDLAPFLAKRAKDPDWCGCNVTIPHKKKVVAYVDEAPPVVRLLGAANCITRRGAHQSRLVADNTDWSGFLEPIKTWADPDRLYKFAYVIGTGGAAVAISYALNHKGFCVINVARDLAKAISLRQRLELFDDDLVMSLGSLSHDRGQESRLPGDWGCRSNRIDCLINTTPLGMTGYPELDVDLDRFPPDMLVYDIVYDPLETHLLRGARERGMPTVDGLGMLIGQAARAFESFFAAKAPRQFDEELRALLTS